MLRGGGGETWLTAENGSSVSTVRHGQSSSYFGKFTPVHVGRLGGDGGGRVGGGGYLWRMGHRAVLHSQSKTCFCEFSLVRVGERGRGDLANCREWVLPVGGMCSIIMLPYGTGISLCALIWY